MADSKEGYKTAFKATSLFGGVQVLTIIIGIVRSKFVAIWLGPSGLGVLSLFTSVIQLLFSISNLGLSSSAVREISLKKNIEDDGSDLSIMIKVLDKWVLYTSVIGAFFSIVFARVLSLLTFGSYQYTWSFVFLSLVILFTGLFNGHYAILQGVRNLSGMAKARVFGSLYGTIVTLPLYYLFQEKGIVLGLIATAFITYIISRYYRNKIQLIAVSVNLKEAFSIGLPAVKLGIMMALSAIAVSIVEFIVKTFILRNSGSVEVGFYQAGWTINAVYLGLVFTAMATDYFPRISQISDNDDELKRKVNEQAEIAILILGPMIIIMLVFLPLIINILYTNQFYIIIPMTKWLLIGSLIKAGSWAVSFVFLAKGDGKKYLFNELGIKFITLPSYLLGYYLEGLIGIGYAFTFNYIIYFSWVLVISNKYYNLIIQRKFWIILGILLLIIISYVLVEQYFYVNLYIRIFYFILITVYSFIEINRRVSIVHLFKNKK